MLSEKDVKSVAVFFYFALLNETLALQASKAVASRLKRNRSFWSFKNKSQAANEVNDCHPSDIVSLTHSEFEKFKKISNKHGLVLTGHSGWILYSGLDMGPWRQFKLEAKSDEFLAVIWSQILQISIAEIAQGLDVTVGTVKHRINRGLRILGEMNKLGSPHV